MIGHYPDEKQIMDLMDQKEYDQVYSVNKYLKNSY